MKPESHSPIVVSLTILTVGLAVVALTRGYRASSERGET